MLLMLRNGPCLLQMPQEQSAASLIRQRLEVDSLGLSHNQAVVDAVHLVDLPFPYLLRYSLDSMCN